jgi:hypothetical protein
MTAVRVRVYGGRRQERLIRVGTVGGEHVLIEVDPLVGTRGPRNTAHVLLDPRQAALLVDQLDQAIRRTWNPSTWHEFVDAGDGSCRICGRDATFNRHGQPRHEVVERPDDG